MANLLTDDAPSPLAFEMNGRGQQEAGERSWRRADLGPATAVEAPTPSTALTSGVLSPTRQRHSLVPVPKWNNRSKSCNPDETLAVSPPGMRASRVPFRCRMPADKQRGPSR